MGSKHVPTKKAAKNVSDCVGCKWLEEETLNTVSHEDTYRARCGKYQHRVLAVWRESEETPRMFPLGIDCKELPD